jgi:CheY-like chemotaxis protein
MDVQMPGLDGLQATHRLRDSDWARPIVALTAHAMIGDRERCLAAGCDGYLAKPVAQRELLETLERFLPEREDKPDVTDGRQQVV